MATTNAEASGHPAPRKNSRKQTTLDSDVTKPSVVEPGDAPFDTTDPTERASSVIPDFAAAAKAGHGTVNAVVPLPDVEPLPEPEGEVRIERDVQRAPDGSLVTVTRNLETGESKVD